MVCYILLCLSEACHTLLELVTLALFECLAVICLAFVARSACRFYGVFRALALALGDSRLTRFLNAFACQLSLFAMISGAFQELITRLLIRLLDLPG